MPNISKVALLRCDSYDYPNLLNTIQLGLDLLGGIPAFFNRGERILLKPNLLSGQPPAKAVTTHPAVFKAIATVMKRHNLNLYYGDSPGRISMERAARRAGIAQVAHQMDILPADFTTGVKISHPGAMLARQLVLARGALDLDAMVNIPKMKTHALTGVTGAVKNLFGCVPGLRKGEYHVKMPDIHQFCQMLVDIGTFLRPRLNIMDGIIAMEGNGPGSGQPRFMGTILMSADPVALDAVFCRLVNIPPHYIPTVTIGQAAGLGNYDTRQIQILGDKIEELICRDFKIIRRKPDRYAARRFFPSFLKPMISPKPVILEHKCTHCHQCIQQCPVSPKAIEETSARAANSLKFNYKSCIRCYCCQEICPQGAISVKIPLLGRLIH